MKIENGSLVVMVDGIEKTVPLPDVTVDAKVKAWSVPVEYRADGLFVAVTERGQDEEVPACDLAACEYLGSLELPASDAAKLDAAKAARMHEINAQSDRMADVLSATYPEFETKSWPMQLQEAKAVTADPNAPAPLLTAIAAQQNITVADLAGRVLTKAEQYAAAYGDLIGRRQAAQDNLTAATTPEAAAAVVL